jgi:hypothetical protein
MQYLHIFSVPPTSLGTEFFVPAVSQIRCLFVEVGDPLVGFVVLQPGQAQACALVQWLAQGFPVESHMPCPISPTPHGLNPHMYLETSTC